ncbi:MAG: lipoyl(octanoyl) transferase LipB [Ignavibacteriales bacterium]|nr:lipoyl(octanoyl) transferase LipB [Ignavibacteriales bacterium]
MQLAVTNIGRTKYVDAWDLQHKLFDLRHYGLIGDLLLFTEHEHVYTIGKGGDENHLLASDAELNLGGIDVFKIDRGGDITYHGPGQVVGYPIIDLNNYFADIHRYLRSLEEVMILALDEFGIEAGREEGLTGVWVKGEKIAACGVKVSRWVTMHGFALNVNTDLQKFERIIPCGIFHKGVTSMQKILGKEIELEEVHQKLTEAFSFVFGCQPISVTPDILRQRVEALEVSISKQTIRQNAAVKN